MSTGRPAHPPGRRESFRASRTGAQNSISASTAANGDLPDPFARRRTPWLNSHRPRSSTAYHHRTNRNCRSVNRNGCFALGPFGCTSHRCAHRAASHPSVNSGRPAGRVSSRLVAGETEPVLLELGNDSLLDVVALI